MSIGVHREALEQIMRICNSARTYTRRTQQIHEVAMYAIGLTANQRTERHIRIMDRSMENPRTARYLALLKARNDYLNGVSETAE